MEPAEVRNLLNEGIQAAKAKEHARARDCLLRVVEADERCEPAWLWLSVALDDPRDQLLALERVLGINPQHPQARAGAEALRQHLGESGEAVAGSVGAATADKAEVATITVNESPATPIVADPTPQPATPPVEADTADTDMLSDEDDPFQCAYCGRQTHPDDERCRHCGRSLLAPGPWQGGGYLYMALLAAGVQLQLALVEALASYLVSTYPQASRILPFAGLLISPLPVPATLRALAWAVVVALLLGEAVGGYGVAALVALIDLAWSGAGYWLGYLPAAQVAANAGVGVVVFLIGLMAVVSQAQSQLRLRVVPDRRLAGAVMFHRRATVYARQGKWALAALHWRRAISQSPAEPQYYKALGRADVRLGRYAEAVRAFKSGAEAAPNDPEFGRLIEQVRVSARNS